jgi:hypothetical protein
VKLTVITITAIMILMPPHIIGRSLTTPLAFAQTTSTCSLGTSGTCFVTGHADGLNNPKSQCVPDINMDSSQAAEYCSGFYAAHKEVLNPTSNRGQGVNQGMTTGGSGQVQQSSGPDWNNICSQVQRYGLLVQSCADLVYPDGTLTQKGQTAVGCIRNGVVLGVGALAITPLSLPLIIDGLKALSVPTGCGNIVNWDAANLDVLNFLKSVIR